MIMSILRDLSSVCKASTLLECLVVAVNIMLRYICLPKKKQWVSISLFWDDP